MLSLSESIGIGIGKGLALLCEISDFTNTGFTPEVMHLVKLNVVMLNLLSYVKSDVVKSKKRSAFFVKSKI